MRIVGVDLGFNKMALCCINVDEKKKFRKSDIVNSVLLKSVEQGDKKHKFAQFILIQRQVIQAMLHNSNLVVIEKPFGAMGYANILWELLGIMKYMCLVEGVEFVEIPPMTLKKFATGKGNAQKSDMVLKAYKEFGVQAESEDEIDAFFCALVGDCLVFKDKYSTSRRESLVKIKR